MEFEEIDFYDYKIRMCVANGIRMYLVSDLLRQYNEKHGTNKRFKKYLENKQTQELIEHMAKSVGWNSSLRSEGSQEGQSTVGPNSGHLSNEALEGQSTGGPNSGHLSNEGQNGKFDICDVIQYVSFSDFGGANQGYIVCEELLHACLMWADPAFACDVFSFLTRLRQEDNDYLRKANDKLNQENKELKSRHVPAEIPDADTTSEWYFYLTYYPSNENIEIRANFCQRDRWNNVQRQIVKNNGCLFYCIKDIPNGWTFKRWMKEPIRKICEKYGGSKLPQCKFSVPEPVWNLKQKEILCSIRLQAKQARIDLGWRTDLNDLNS